MANIYSSVGNNKPRASNQQNPGRNWTVPDSENIPVIPNNIDFNDLVQQSTEGQSRQMVNPAEVARRRNMAMEQTQQNEHLAQQESVNRINIITGIGRKTKEVTVNDIVFTLRSLKSFEQNCYAQAIETAERFSSANGQTAFKPTSLFKIKLEALAHSLYLIDGKNVDLILGTINSEYEDQIDQRKSLLSNMDGALIDYLFNKFDELSKETYDGYIPKTEEDMKEVAQAIHKSS